MKNHLFFLIGSLIIAIFLIAFGITTYRYYQAIHSDDPIDPFVFVEKGDITITRGDLAIDLVQDETYHLSEGDIIITRQNSQGLVQWPDHSTTRLGPNSRLVIEKMQVADDYSHIELVASLESGKAWTNIVRTLYPGSHVQFRIPKNGLVAGVRGTVFDINLDANSIRAIDHSVSLKNSLGAQVVLMAGEGVQVTNIFKKIQKTLDSTWDTLNLQKDALYNTIRSEKLQNAYDTLVPKSGVFLRWDRFVSRILKNFDAFSDLSLLQAMTDQDIETIAQMPMQYALKWYQSFQSTNFVQQREILRGSLLSSFSKTKNTEMLASFTRGAIWDRMAFSGATLKYADQIIHNYADTFHIRFDSLTNALGGNINEISSTLGDQIQELFQN